MKVKSGLSDMETLELMATGSLYTYSDSYMGGINPPPAFGKCYRTTPLYGSSSYESNFSGCRKKCKSEATVGTSRFKACVDQCKGKSSGVDELMASLQTPITDNGSSRNMKIIGGAMILILAAVLIYFLMRKQKSKA